MNRMKKWFAFLLILALTLTSALALAEQTTITMSTWLATEDGTKAVYQEMLDDFMTANPDIKVEVIALPFNQNKDQVLLAGTNGDAADVIMGNSQMMGAFNAAGLCAELDGLIDPEIVLVSAQGQVDDLVGRIREVTSRDCRVLAARHVGRHA